MTVTRMVSAICPTRNRPRFLVRAVELFLAQDHPIKEMVIVDSSDRPIDLPPDSRLRVVKVEPPLAIGTAYKIGIEAARGEFLAIWDDDDWSAPSRLSRTVARLDAFPSVDAVGLTPLIVTAPDVKFYRWADNTIKGWHNGGSAWLPCSDNAIVWRADKSQRLNHGEITMDMFKRMYDCGARFDAIDNDELFAYVRHSGVAWKFDPLGICTPVARPAWVTDEMVEFWRGVR